MNDINLENLNNKHAMRILLSIGFSDLNRAVVYIANKDEDINIEETRQEILRKSDLNMVTWMQGYIKAKMDEHNMSISGYTKPYTGYLLTDIATTVIAIKMLKDLANGI